MQANSTDPDRTAPAGAAATAEEKKAMEIVTATDLSEVKLEAGAQLLIGQHLKAMYSEILRQPVPDQFLRLLEELEHKERDQ